MLRKFAFCACIALLTAVCSAQQNYASQTVTIRAGILMINSDTVDWDPYALYNLDLETHVKPNGWTIDNPDHPGNTYTKQDAGYWQVPLDSTSDTKMADYDVLVLAAHATVQLSPLERERLRQFMDNGGILWIDLNTGSSLDSVNGFPVPFKLSSAGAPTIGLANYQHPLMQYPTTVTYNDLSNIAGNIATPSGSGGVTITTGGPVGFAPDQSGITYLQTGDVSSVQQESGPLPYLSEVLQPIAPTTTASQLISIASVGDGFEVVTTQDVLTILNQGSSSSASSAANTEAVANTPSFNVQTDSAAKLAFNILGLTSEYGQVEGGARKQGSTRNDMGAPVIEQFTDAGTVSYTAGSSNFSYNPPVAYKGMVVVSTNNQILVYNAEPPPSQSPYGYANYADPLGSQFGFGYDLLWSSSSFSTTISPPTCFEVNISGTEVDEVWVLDANGKLWGFNLTTGAHSGTNVAPDQAIAPPTENGTSTVDPGVPANGPYAPTYQDGLLFVSDCTASSNVGGGYAGRIWIANPEGDAELETVADGANPWSVGGTPSTGIQNQLVAISGSPTVGYIPIKDGSGGLDRVLYVPVRATTTGTSETAGAGVASIWIGAKGEASSATTPPTISGNVLTITTRANNKGSWIFVPTTDSDPQVLSLAPKLTVIQTSTGLPFSQSQMQTVFGSGSTVPTQTSAGILQYSISNPSALPTTSSGLPDYSFRLDYTLDWGEDVAQGIATTPLRGTANFSDDPGLSSSPRRILDNVVMGPTGIIYAVLSTQDPTGDNSNENGGGSYYAIQETIPGNFDVLSRWDLYDQFSQSLIPSSAGQSSTSSTTVLPAVSNQDPLLSLFPFLGSASPLYAGQMQYLTFTSGPVLSGGYVYVTGQGFTDQYGGVPDTILFAFKAVPPPLEINLPNTVTSSGTLLFSDITGTSEKTAPPTTTFTYTVSTTQPNVVVLSSLSQSQSGQLVPCLSQSVPVVVSENGASSALIYPDQTGSTWSPLAWYTVLTGCGLSPNVGSYSPLTSAIGPPFVSGNTVFVPTVKMVSNAYALQGSFSASSLSPVATLYGINANVGGNDPFFIPDQHPWQSQLVSLTAPPGQALTANNLVPDPKFLWPQLSGITSYSQLQERFAESQLGGSPMTFGVVGGGGRVFSWSPTGLYAFERSTITVADSGRVAEFDAGGNPIWSTDQSVGTGSGDIPNVGRVHPLINPTRAYRIDTGNVVISQLASPLANGNVVVTDAGGNRLAILDQMGLEQRSIDSFSIDPGFNNGAGQSMPPNGYMQGEPLTFSGPRDVFVYRSIVANGAATAPAITNPFSNQSATGYEYWIHYLVADSGNKRVLDIVDRYAYDNTNNIVDGPIALGLLYRQSPATVSSGQFSYTTLTRVYDPSSVGGQYGLTGWVDILGIGNPVFPTGNAPTVSPTPATGNGGIVLWYETAVPGLEAPPTLISSVAYQGTPTGNIFFAPSSEITGAFTQAAANLGPHPIGDLNSLTARYYAPNGGTSGLYIMFTDNSGVYEITPSGTPLLSATWNIDWMLPRYVVTANSSSPTVYTDSPVYSVIRRDSTDNPTNLNALDFVPTYASRLSNGDILVVNGYMGRYRKNASAAAVQFQGEVLEISGSAFSWSGENLGFNGATITYEMPPVSGIRGLVTPRFAHRD